MECESTLARAFKQWKTKNWTKIISSPTLLREQRNSDLAKDISRQEQHLSPLCNWYELYCYSKMSLHLVDQHVNNVHTFCVIISLHQKNTPKNIFLHISKREFQLVKGTFWVHFRGVFNVFCWNLERTLPDNHAKRQCRGIFIFCFFQKLRVF